MVKIRFSVIASLLLITPVLFGAEEVLPDKEKNLGFSVDEKSSKGYTLYQNNCAVCHDVGVARAPHRSMLAFMSSDAVYRTLDSGIMRQQASSLSSDEKQEVARYLTGYKVTEEEKQPARVQCAKDKKGFDFSQAAMASAWGLTKQNTRLLPSNIAGINKNNIGRLKLKWSFAFPGGQRARSQPLIAGGVLFIGSYDGTVYALDYQSGCSYWSFTARSEVRTGIVISPWDSSDRNVKPTLYFGDWLGNVYAVNALDGSLVWNARTDEHPNTTLTGTPTLHNGRLYVPVSSLEVVPVIDKNVPCCTFRGSVIAYEADSGNRIWQTYSVEKEPTFQGKNKAGTDQFGPSGAPIWNSPAIDEKRNQLYVGTGQNYSSPADSNSDAIIAMDLDTGARRWVFQATVNDAWNSACVVGDGYNCPVEDGPDVDFGAATVLAVDSDGRDYVVAGQKSGMVHALDPDSGSLIWQKKVGRGGIHGGVHFGMAVAGDSLFVPVSDRDESNFYTEQGYPGLYALDLRNGEYQWKMPLDKACVNGTGCVNGLSAAITATPELVFSGALNGWLQVYDASSGKIIWRFDTAQEFASLSGMKARGGGIDGSAGPIPYNGMLFVNSGYNFAGSKPGNVLLAFTIE
jgi:polyvinyl alcohol dehydrogenase (cytochrome)